MTKPKTIKIVKTVHDSHTKNLYIGKTLQGVKIKDWRQIHFYNVAYGDNLDQ